MRNLKFFLLERLRDSLEFLLQIVDLLLHHVVNILVQSVNRLGIWWILVFDSVNRCEPLIFLFKGDIVDRILESRLLALIMLLPLILVLNRMGSRASP